MIKTYEKNGSLAELLGPQVVYAHDISTLPGFARIISQVEGVEKYDRVVAIARSNDVVLLKNRPEESYLQWLEEVGLGTRKIMVMEGTDDETLPQRALRNGTRTRLESLLGNSKKTVLSPYYGGESEKQASDYLGLFMYAETETVERFDSKINFKKLCEQIGVPVAEYAIFDTKQGASELTNLVKCMLDETGDVIVRGEYGASASTTYVLNGLDLALINKIIENSGPEDRYLVEPFYEILSSPSSTWFITKDKRIVHLRTSNQILNGGTAHDGNEFPVPFDEEPVNESSFKMAQYLAEEGFIGPVGFDYIEKTRKEMLAVECNPRVTGAMYPWELVNILEKNGSIKAARSQNILLPRKGFKFEDIRKVWDDLLYNGRNGGHAIFPYNTGPLPEGKITVLGTGSSKEEVDSLFDLITSRLKEL